MNKCAKFYKDSPSGKNVKFNLLSVIEPSETADFVYNFIETYASEQLRWHIWPTFPLNFFMKFSQKIPLYVFYFMVQGSQKWPKTQIKGSCLNLPVSMKRTLICVHWPGSSHHLLEDTLLVFLLYLDGMEKTQWHLPGDVFFCLGPSKRSIFWMSQYQTPSHHGWRRPMHSLTRQDSACPSNEKWLFFNRSSSLSNFRTRSFEEKFFNLLSQSSTMSRDVCRQVIIFLLLQIQLYFIIVQTSQVPLKSQFSESVISVPFLVTRLNRPIVFLQSGHEVRGIPDVWSYKKHCFLHFSETLSWPIMVLNDWFCQLAWNTPLLFDDVLVLRWHWEKARFEWLSPLSEWPVPRHHSGSVVLTWAPEGQQSRGKIHLMLEENASLKFNNKMREWSDEPLSSSVSPSGVIFKAGSVHRWVGYMYRHWAFARTTKVYPNQKKHTNFYRTDKGIQVLFLFFFLLSSFFLKKKETAAFELPGSKKGWVDHIQAMHLIGICARAQTQLSNFRRERFRPCKLLVVLIGLAPIPRRQPKFYRDSLMEYRFFEDNGESAYGALCMSIDCQASKGFTRQLHKFSFEKKKNPIGQSKNQRTVRNCKMISFPWEVPWPPRCLLGRKLQQL